MFYKECAERDMLHIIQIMISFLLLLFDSYKNDEI